MDFEIKLQDTMNVCNFCNISYPEHRNKNPEDWKYTSACGFVSWEEPALGWIHCCPTCDKLREDYASEFIEIKELLIEARRRLSKLSQSGEKK